MEQIVKREDKYYYGELQCYDVEEAYARFRNDYHERLGRDKSRRLDKVNQRVERIHGFGFDREDSHALASEFDGFPKTKSRILGLVLIHYIRIIGSWDCPELDEERFERWFEWAFTRRSGGIKTVGQRQKTGRTSKRLKTRYR